MPDTNPPTPSSPAPRKTNSVVDAEMRKRCLTEAVEHAAKPWSLDAEDKLIRDVVLLTVDAVESKMQNLTTGRKPLRPLAAVQALVQTAWLAGFHAGRHYEVALAKAKRAASKTAGEERKRATAVRRTQRARSSAEQAQG